MDRNGFLPISLKLFFVSIICPLLLITLANCTDSSWDPRARDMADRCSGMAEKAKPDLYCEVFSDCCDIALREAQCLQLQTQCNQMDIETDKACKGYNCTILPPTPAPT